jgi:hypothetical protein
LLPPHERPFYAPVAGVCDDSPFRSANGRKRKYKRREHPARRWKKGDEKRVNLTLLCGAGGIKTTFVCARSAAASVELTSRNLRIVSVLKVSIVSLVLARLFQERVKTTLSRARI